MNRSSLSYVIRDALRVYDNTQPVINFINNETIIKIIKSDTYMKRDTLKLIYKETSDFICEIEIEIIGTFYSSGNKTDVGIWEWAWANANISPNQNHYAKELLLYGLKLGKEDEYYKKILITSSGIIKDLIQLDIIISIARSLIKLKYGYICPYTTKNGDDIVTTYYLFIPNDDFKEFTAIINSRDYDK